MPDRRPLPLVTADGPVCQAECGHLHTDRAQLHDFRFVNVRICDQRGLEIGECLPALREAWLRERDRVKRTCGRCVRGVGCPDADGVMDHDESCSRFEERKDG